MTGSERGISAKPRKAGRRRLLVADYAPTRIGIRLALEGEYDIGGEAGDAEHTIDAARRERPDLCLIGLELPGGAVAAVSGVCLASPATSVVVLSATHDVDDLLAVIRAGAIGYISGGADPERLRRAMAAVANGEAAVSRAMVLDLVRELQGAGARTDGFTVREAQVLSMLQRGQSTGAIAQRLGISPVTVRRHISSMMEKMGATSRADLLSAGPGGENFNAPDRTDPPAAR